MHYNSHKSPVIGKTFHRVKISGRGSQVVGAGRGPLVRASLKAAAETGRRIRVFAVEKNPNAVVTLQNLVASEGCACLLDLLDPISWSLPRGAPTCPAGSALNPQFSLLSGHGSSLLAILQDVKPYACC